MFDVMKNICLCLLSLLLVLASLPTWAVAQAPSPDHYRAFISHIEVAVGHRDLAAIQALYRTNGVAAAELKSEMSRWPDLLAGEAKQPVAMYFKELSTLPPEAHEAHTGRARRLTTQPVTHLVSVRLPAGYQVTLPLVLVGDRLWIVPSDKRRIPLAIEPSGPVNGSQQIHPETNRPPPAAGPRR